MFRKQQLHNYQIAAIEHIKRHPSSGLFLDMGLGKTVSTLTAIKFLMYEDLEISRVLVIAPKRVAEHVWVSEVGNWEHLKGLTVSVVAGSEKHRRAALAKKADIYCISRDNTAWLCGLYGGTSLPFDMLVVDESSSFKNPKSQRFKALRKVVPSFKRVVILTGTPSPNGLLDLWSQIYLLDQGKRLGKFITHYRDQFFRPNQRNGAVIYNYKLRDKTAEQRIYRKISDICISMKSEDYLALPERIDNVIDVTFPEALQQQYNEFEREQVLALFAEEGEPGTITAINAAALSNKLLQFAGGAVYDENRVVHAVHELKLDALEEIIDTNDGSVLIAWNYQHERDRILKHFTKYNPRTLQNGKDIQDWNDGKIRLLLMHPASGGHGLNLQAGGNVIVWYSPTWSLELYLQLNARLHRQGQQSGVIVHHIVAHKTIDSEVVSAIKRKTAGQEGLLKAVKARIKKYIK